MPGFDGSGSVGRGPMSGWGRGDCVMPIRQSGGGWAGRGFGRGSGLRARRFAQFDGGSAIGEELARLREQVAELQKSLHQK